MASPGSARAYTPPLHTYGPPTTTEGMEIIGGNPARLAGPRNPRSVPNKRREIVGSERSECRIVSADPVQSGRPAVGWAVNPRRPTGMEVGWAVNPRRPAREWDGQSTLGGLGGSFILHIPFISLDPFYTIAICIPIISLLYNRHIIVI